MTPHDLSLATDDVGSGGNRYSVNSSGTDCRAVEEADSFTEQHRNYVNEDLVEQACI